LSDVSEELTASIIILTTLMMESASFSETSVSIYHSTRRNIQEGSHLHTRRREKLKSHLFKYSISTVDVVYRRKRREGNYKCYEGKNFDGSRRIILEHTNPSFT
jgi:hypothetical protein